MCPGIFHDSACKHLTWLKEETLLVVEWMVLQTPLPAVSLCSFGPDVTWSDVMVFLRTNLQGVPHVPAVLSLIMDVNLDI